MLAFGEDKPLAQWVKDPRNKAGLSIQGLTRRLYKMRLEEALTAPRHPTRKKYTWKGITLSPRGWAKRPENVHGYSHNIIRRRLEANGGDVGAVLTCPRQKSSGFTYQGETKRLREWVKDPRCVCTSLSTLESRLYTQGYDFATALTRPLTPYNSKNPLLTGPSVQV